MQIKQIDLIGFKSFCDKISLNFERPITGIVGPNGCGKSNVVDALRWAMGEQSARHLRGKTMEDVIFNGSDSRGPSGMAEVSITFSNDGVVPIEYLNYSEITVTRRLSRDGTSEYLLNKVPCRLRDITNLFLGTGVGTKAYSIIEQGRIGLIVSAKPEDRRIFIEEAAGITKYQRRKKAAERKMDATRQNLLRVTDVLEEMDKRLGSLRRQAKKAERYKNYREEMQEIELWFASHRLLELLGEQRFRQQHLEELETQDQEAQRELERREADLEAARMAAMELERQVNSVNEHLYSLDNQIKLNENTIQFHTHEAEELEQRVQEAQIEREELRKQLSELDLQLVEQKERTEHLSKQRDALLVDVSRAEESLSVLQEELEEVKQAIDQERREIARSEQEETRAEAGLRAMLQRRRDVQERGDQQREEVHSLLDRIAGLKMVAKDLNGELDDLRADMGQLMQRRETTKTRLEELGQIAERGEAELEGLRNELHRRRSRLTSLKEVQERYEGFSRGTRAIMRKQKKTTEKNDRILGLVADAVEAPEDYETALEAVLGQRLGTVIVEEDKDSLEAIAYLKASVEGRSSFIARWPKSGGILNRAPVGFVWEPEGRASARTMLGVLPTSVDRAHPGFRGPILDLVKCRPEFLRVARSLLGDVIVMDTIDNALYMWESIEGKTLVTLDGEILEPDGTVTGGSQEAELSGILRQKREAKELKVVINELEQQYKVSLDNHVAVKTEIASLTQILEEVTREGHQGEKDILTREKDLSRATSEIETLSTRQDELEHGMARMRNLLDDLDQQERQFRERLEKAAQERELGVDILFLLECEHHRLSTQTRQATKGLTDQKIELAQAETSWRSVSGMVQRIEEMGQDKLARIDRLQGDREEGLARARELKEQVEALKEELLLLVSERSQDQKKLERGREGYEEHLAVVGEQELALKEVRFLVSNLSAEMGQLRIKLSELSMSQSHLEEQIWDRYRKKLPSVIGEFHLRPPVTDEQIERLSRLQQLIERMGHINLTAIEEYEELSERHEFLSTHKEDLEGALNQLHRAIQKINRTSRRRFKETYELVNNKFQDVFPRLFKGGRARLQLTDPDNVLESGVEIIAQPPGKKLQSIELLSGGEKALTAVSLIFSMFLVKPTPFCLLDEVDAPLDEANVGRFNEMVRETSKISQFILITHNRRTMEIVDRLYGVTMEEPGISKLVAVSMEDGQEEAAA